MLLPPSRNATRKNTVEHVWNTCGTRVAHVWNTCRTRGEDVADGCLAIWAEFTPLKTRTTGFLHEARLQPRTPCCAVLNS